MLFSDLRIHKKQEALNLKISCVWEKPLHLGEAPHAGTSVSETIAQVAFSELSEPFFNVLT